MLDCETCGKRHKTEALIEKCKARAERAAAVLAKRQAEVDRRLANAATTPPEEFIVKRRWHGDAWDKIVAGLKKDYPDPGSWRLCDVVESFSASRRAMGYW